ncbi:anhydro-N-acetylmuramic acid kinase [Chitinibacter bivalviorum]|uniref:Anhydro-N-acetylmuramic acid kinase n=1 Tax=Chitinibacter bivalviorum TaxID=2739434 RepID=A0A7H9BGF8_9NEIS|nr:anhydro-N-acetylmuramic acid kinase [Chitinibacter bivalviorum]QLG87687.1 anhydro-N-acetylmuramic acid kinase [Chitinibacter bivalviorum]
MTANPSPRYFIGLMTGTSLDGIDAVLVDFATPTPELIATHSADMPDELRADLMRLQSPSDNEIHLTHLAANAHSRVCADVVAHLLQQANITAAQIIAIGNHGQTIRHRPELGYTIQIGNNAALAEYTGITVVGDFRSRDIAAGGQGAPLVPAFHQAIFGTNHTNRVIVNIGGIANISWLGQDGYVSGFDSGPGNVLMDLWVQQHKGLHYDANGEWAASGRPDEGLLTQMLSDPYFSHPAPKSTGRDLFHRHWLESHLAQFNRAIKAEDVQATLAQLTASTIASAINSQGKVDEVFVCGGGAYNQYLMDCIAAQLACPVLSTANLGVDPSWVEAYAFAWLAMRCIDRQSGNLPAVTGAAGLRILGAIYPH